MTLRLPSPRLRSFIVLLCASLAACGGGVSLSVGDGGFDHPPQASLAVSLGSAFAGETIDLAAAASDDFAVRRVDFWRSDSTGTFFLGSDASPPYGLRTAMPPTPDGGVSYLARAVDDIGQTGDSAWVVVFRL